MGAPVRTAVKLSHDAASCLLSCLSADDIDVWATGVHYSVEVMRRAGVAMRDGEELDEDRVAACIDAGVSP